MKPGDRVAWKAYPEHVGTIDTYDALCGGYEISWDHGGHSFMGGHDLLLLPSGPVRILADEPAVCRCPIKDLTSVGHTDPNCPEKKR